MIDEYGRRNQDPYEIDKYQTSRLSRSLKWIMRRDHYSTIREKSLRLGEGECELKCGLIYKTGVNSKAKRVFSLWSKDLVCNEVLMRY